METDMGDKVHGQANCHQAEFNENKYYFKLLGILDKRVREFSRLK
jgi:hypothetical protein